MQKQVLKVAKLETIHISQKMVIQPHALRNEFPQDKVPFLTDSSIVIELKRYKLSPARINSQGQMLAEVRYIATQLSILKKYVEVDVIEEFEGRWIGTLFDINVEGHGGEGDVRGCVVEEIKNGTIFVKGFSQRGNPSWIKIKQQTDRKLQSGVKPSSKHF